MKWKQKRDPLDRLFAMLSDGGGCWVHRSPDSAGYGRIWATDRLHYAHRYAFERLRTEIPDGLVIDHLCRNRSCCNPWHMEVVTQQVNCLRGERAGQRVTHCKRGHEYTPENTYTNPQGYRSCRTCKKEKTA